VLSKCWHQLLRRPLTAPANFLAHNVSKLPRHSIPVGVITVASSFALSGALHTAAEISSGIPAHQLGVFRFFCTRALGVIVEQGIVSLFRKIKAENHQGRKDGYDPVWYVRIAGYAWVMAFMTWTGPSWICPQAAKASAQGTAAFLPFSVIGWIRGS
jgi:hypothetical protein